MILAKLWCWLTTHNWTCAANEDIPPTADQLKDVAGFHDYAKMYCKRCGYVYERK